MFDIVGEQDFESAHYLRGYRGKCENLHGHRYSVVVRLRTEKQNEIGLAYDFTDVKRHLREIIGRYDHACLNEIEPFVKLNPSAENIAVEVHRLLLEKLQNEPLEISAVEIWENPQQGVVYKPD